MSRARKLLDSTLLAVAGTALVPAVAAAATLSGTVVGRPVSAGRSVSVPVLLSSAGEHAAGTAVARVLTAQAGGLRTPGGRIAPLELRIGDRVTARVARITARPRVASLAITRRAAPPSFASIDAQKRTVTAEIARAIAQAQRITAAPTSALNPAAPAASNAALREQLRAVRTELNLLIASLRTSAAAFDATVAQIVAARPRDASRGALIAHRQRPTLDGLSADAAAARAAANGLDAAVARLDAAIDAVGDPSAAPLPIQGVAGVSSLLYAVLDLLRG